MTVGHNWVLTGPGEGLRGDSLALIAGNPYIPGVEVNRAMEQERNCPGFTFPLDKKEDALFASSAIDN
jgi:hypothetical protein